jgi:phage-related protein (TIGR01555 family)
MAIAPGSVRGPKPNEVKPDRSRLFAPPRTLAQVPDEVRAASDQALATLDSLGIFEHTFEMGQYPAWQFLGYSFLSKLTENGIVKACVTSVVDDMTRSWIEIVRQGDDKDESRDKLKAIESALRDFGVQKLLRRAALCTGYFGGCLIFIDTAGGFKLEEPLDLGPNSLEMRAGGLRRLALIEPVNVSPGTYNSSDPLSEDFYRPSDWLVMGKRIHASRLVRMHGALPPQLLLPAYNFLGIPQAQILWDYVMHFQRDRVSASDMLNKYSTKVLKTDMSAVLSGGEGDQFLNRVRLFAQVGNNDGVLALDKEREDFIKVESTLSGVTDIVQQSLELICAVNSTPVVKTLGLSPKGFNATGDVDLRNYYDRISALQEQQLAPVLGVILELVQLHLFGEVDENISYTFKPLSEDDRQVRANVQKTLADTYAVYIDRGVVGQDEVRQNLIADKDSGFDDVRLEDLPDEAELYGETGETLAQAPAAAAPEILTAQQQALNGAQITSLLEVINSVAMRQLPRESGVNIIMSAFNMSHEQADRIMGTVGGGFVPGTLPGEGPALGPLPVGGST